jgi:uncharacterized membrane protein YhaH (DUF805 family)
MEDGMAFVNYLLGWQGRIGRLQWWLGGFVQALILAIAFFAFIGGAEAKNPASLVLGVPLILVALWFGICLSIKRLHDHNKSGFWFFVYFIPVVGLIWQLIECGLLRGTEGHNDYGPDPRFRFDVSEDIEALASRHDRETASYQGKAMPKAPVAKPVSLAPAGAAGPVFGKRIQAPSGRAR